MTESEPQLTSFSDRYRQQVLAELRAELRAEARKARLNRWTLNLMLTVFLGFAGYSVAAPYVLNSNFFSDGTYSSSIASGNNGFAITTNGARVDFGAGANDYCSSDGTTVTYAGPMAANGMTTSNGLIVSASGININNSGGYVGWNSDVRGAILYSSISAANAGATPSLAAFRLYTDNALDATDYVFHVGDATNANSLFRVTYAGDATATGGSIAAGHYSTDNGTTNGVFESLLTTGPMSLISDMNAATASSTVPASRVCASTTLDADDLLFGVGASGGCSTEKFSVDNEGDVVATGSYGLGSKMHWSATTPTIVSGGCTSPSISSGGDSASFNINIGTSCTGVTDVVVGLPTSARYWNCWATTSAPDTREVEQVQTGSATQATFRSYSRTTGAPLDWTASQTVQVGCVAGGF